MRYTRSEIHADSDTHTEWRTYTSRDTHGLENWINHIQSDAQATYVGSHRPEAKFPTYLFSRNIEKTLSTTQRHAKGEIVRNCPVAANILHGKKKSLSENRNMPIKNGTKSPFYHSKEMRKAPQLGCHEFKRISRDFKKLLENDEQSAGGRTSY